MVPSPCSCGRAVSTAPKPKEPSIPSRASEPSGLSSAPTVHTFVSVTLFQLLWTLLDLQEFPASSRWKVCQARHRLSSAAPSVLTLAMGHLVEQKRQFLSRTISPEAKHQWPQPVCWWQRIDSSILDKPVDGSQEGAILCSSSQDRADISLVHHPWAGTSLLQGGTCMPHSPWQDTRLPAWNSPLKAMLPHAHLQASHGESTSSYAATVHLMI